jgi:hypothetical protein
MLCAASAAISSWGMKLPSTPNTKVSPTAGIAASRDDGIRAPVLIDGPAHPATAAATTNVLPRARIALQ